MEQPGSRKSNLLSSMGIDSAGLSEEDIQLKSSRLKNFSSSWEYVNKILIGLAVDKQRQLKNENNKLDRLKSSQTILTLQLIKKEEKEEEQLLFGLVVSESVRLKNLLLRIKMSSSRIFSPSFCRATSAIKKSAFYGPTVGKLDSV